MKTVAKSLVLVMASYFCSSAFGEQIITQKAPLRADDFNKLIDGASFQRQQIAEQAPPTSEEMIDEVLNDEREQVSIFLDTEIGHANDPRPIVDRRYDSISEATLVDIKQVSEDESGF